MTYDQWIAQPGNALPRDIPMSGADRDRVQRESYQMWSQNPDNMNYDWTQTTTLDPKLQAALDQQLQLQGRRSTFANQLFGQVENAFQNPLDYSGVKGVDYGESARKAGFDAAYNQATSRLDPQWQQRQQQMETQLINQGFQRGTEGWDKAMDELNRARNDAYAGATNYATLTGEQLASGEFGRSLAGRQQGITEIQQQRDAPMNELMALLNGQQVQQPQFPGFAQSNMLGASAQQYQAALNQYSAQQAQQQGQYNALASLPFLLAI